MKPITRTKEIVREHRGKILFTSGVVIGAAGILVWGHRLNMSKPPFELFLAADNESLKALIDNPAGAIRWTHNTNGAIVNVINETHPQL